MSRRVQRVAVLWSRLGPYHVARLRALGAFLEARGATLSALETASADETYAWEAESASRTTLFPDRSFESVAGPEMEAAVEVALDREQPDAVAVPSYSTPDSRAALAWCRRHRRVAVMMFDSRRQDAERAEWREVVKRTIVSQFDAALVAGTPQRAYAEVLGIPPSHVFQPVDVVDNERFARLAGDARRERDLEDGRRFVVVSRLTPRKGVDVLVEAYNQYYAQVSDPWSLVIVGDGPERERLENMAGPGITFAGFVQGDAVPKTYGQADAVVLPSLADPWGLVVNEAMAAGLPVVVSTGAGCATDLVDGNGLTVPPGDAAALARALEVVSGLGDDERAAWGARSLEIIAGFDLEAFCAGLWDAIEAGHSKSDRGLSLSGRAVLATLRLAARRPRAFQTVPD